MLALRMLDDIPVENAQELAGALRDLIRDTYGSGRGIASGSSDDAILHLLGLSTLAARQPRPLRRALAARAMEMNLDTFQKRYEQLLLREVADELWRQHQRAERAAAAG